jgi:hypothetical protein
MGTGGNVASFATDAFTPIQEHLVPMQSALLASTNVLPVGEWLPITIENKPSYFLDKLG